MVSKRTFLWFAVLLLTLTTAGCAASDGQVPGPPVSTKPALPILRVHLDTEPASLDPAQVQSQGDLLIIAALYETLLTYDEYTERPGAGLAQDWEESSDGLSYTFKLRPNVYFASQKPFNAAAVKYSWERVARSSPWAYLLQAVTGYEEYKRGEIAELPGIKVVGDSTLEVVLSYPDPEFLLKLTHPALMIVDPQEAAKTGDTFGTPGHRVAAGTGPYLLSEWVPGKSLALTSNDNREALPAMRRVEIGFSGSVNTVLTEFTAGDWQLIGTQNPQYLDHPAVNTPGLSALGSVLGLSFPGDGKSPWQQPDLKQALLMAIDRQKLAAQPAKLVEATASSVPWGTSSTVPAAQPNLARQIIEEYQLSVQNQLPPLVLAYSPADLADVAQALAAQWQEVGLEPQVVSLEEGLTADIILNRWTSFGPPGIFLNSEEVSETVPLLREQMAWITAAQLTGFSLDYRGIPSWAGLKKGDPLVNSSPGAPGQ